MPIATIYAGTAAITMGLYLTQNQRRNGSNAKNVAFGYMNLVAKTKGGGGGGVIDNDERYTYLSCL